MHKMTFDFEVACGIRAFFLRCVSYNNENYDNWEYIRKQVVIYNIKQLVLVIFSVPVMYNFFEDTTNSAGGFFMSMCNE